MQNRTQKLTNTRTARRARSWWKRRDPLVRRLPVYLWQALRNFFRDGVVGTEAAGLAFYLVFSLFPLILLLAVGIGRLVGPAVAQEQILNALRLFLPPGIIEPLQANFREAINQSGSFGLVAIGGLVWAGLGLFTDLTRSLDRVFSVPAGRSMWRQRFMASLMTLILTVLVAASFLTAGVLRLVSALLLERPSVWVSAAIYFLPLGLNMVIFALLFRYVPARYVYWDAVWPAAIFGAIGWELTRIGFGWYLANLARYQFVYGSIAAVIVMLLWAYLTMSVFLLSAELCARLNEWFQEMHEVRRQRMRAAYLFPGLPRRTTPRA